MASINLVEDIAQLGARFDIARGDLRRIEFHAWSILTNWGSLVATIGDTFHYEGDPLVEVALAQDSDPCDVACVLRKMADVLDGPSGHVVMSLPQRDDGSHPATVCGVRLYSHYDDFLCWEDDREEF